MGIGFDDFITKLGRETVNAIQKEQNKTTPHPQKVENIIEENKKNPPKMEKKKIRKPELEEENFSISNPIDEEFLEKALEYGNVVVKSVKQSFKDPTQRRKVLESIRNSVNFVLGNPQEISHDFQHQPTQNQQNKNIQEDSFSTLQQASMNLAKMKTTSEENSQSYSNDLHMSLQENGDVDISQMSQQDIADILALSGTGDRPDLNQTKEDFDISKLPEEEQAILREAL